MGASSTISIVITAIDDASAQIASVFDGVSQKASAAQETIAGLGTQMTIAGAAMTEIGSKVTGFMQSVIDAGTQSETASESLTTTISSLISAAQEDTASKDANNAATQKLNAQHATLTAQINLEQEALQKAIDKYGQNSPQVADAAAKIQTYEASLQKVNDALSQHQALLNLAGASVTALSSKFTTAADTNVKLGFSVDDSLRSFQSLVQATHDVTQSMDLNALAMNLARDKQEDLGTATNQIVQILEGGGRAAKQFGINMSETATPAQALAQLTQMLGGQAQAYADGPAGKAAIAQAEWNKTMEDAGTTILPIVDALIEKIGGLVAWIDAFVQAHPKLAQAILIGIAVFGGLLLVLGSIMLVVGPLLIAFGTMGGVVAIAVVAIIAGIAVLATIVTLIASNWANIKLGAEVFWNGLVTLITNVIDTIEGIVQGFVTKIQNMFNAVTSMIRTISSAAGTVANVLINPVGAAVNLATSVMHVNDAIITPSGQVIQTAADDYLLATKTPGSLGGSRSGGVNVYIQGGNYLDSQGATMIANAIGQQIVRQLRVSNFN